MMDAMDMSIQGHDAFFARIIDMIPRDLYRPAEEEDEEVLNKRYHKHRKMPLQTDERKALSKKRLKEIYTPEEEKESSAPVVEDEEKEESSSDVAENDNEGPSVDDGLDALRKRLQARISSLKGNRSTGERATKKNNKGKQVPKNKPAKTASILSSKTTENVDDVAKQVSMGVLEDMMSNGKDDRVEMGEDITYSGLVDSSAGVTRADSGKSGSKLRRLKKLIEDTENKKKRINDLKSQGEAGKELALQEQWTDALKEASGSKVIANTAKIKKTIKRKEKAKEKSAREWAERTANVESAINKRIDKREENLLKRKRGPDWILSAEEMAEQKEKEKEKKKGIPIKGKFGHNNKDKTSENKGSSGSDAKKKGRAGFEGKKVDFLNKKQKK